jgi:hypothetical protein
VNRYGSPDHSLANAADVPFLLEADPNEVAFSLVASRAPRHEPYGRVGNTHPAHRLLLRENEQRMLQHMLASLGEMIETAGGRIVGAPGYTTPGGGVRARGRNGPDGHRPANVGPQQLLSGVDAPNVYLMDGAAWPSSGWQNPTFTMMAVAGRASRHLATS